MSDVEYYDPPVHQTFQTLVMFDEIGVPMYSARGLRQTLTPIEQSKQLSRTINGDLVDLSVDSFRKYASSIMSADHRSPAIDGVWPGRELTVDCVAELAFITGSQSPQRPLVPGSSLREEHGYTFYRPRLVMLVTSYSVEHDEWGAVVSWTLELEEV